MNLNDTVKASEELRLAMESGDADTIAQTVVRNAWPLYNFRYERAREAVNSLPTAVLERYPVVRMIHPLTPVLAHGGNEHLAPLLAPGDIRGMSAEQLSVLFLAQMVAHRLSGDVATAMGYAQQLRERIEQVSVDALGLADGPLWFLHHQIGSTMLAAGDTSGALREFATTGNSDCACASRTPSGWHWGAKRSRTRCGDPSARPWRRSGRLSSCRCRPRLTSPQRPVPRAPPRR